MPLASNSRWLALLASLFLSACAEPPIPVVAFETAGGEAWSFEKTVTVRAETGDCDTLAIASSRGKVAASVVEPKRFVARVPLMPGHNEVEATCYVDGSAKGPAAVQQWFVRLPDLPKAWTDLRLTPGGLILDGSSSDRAQASEAPLTSFEWRARRGNPAPLPGLPAEGQQVTIAAPSEDGEYYVTLEVTDSLGRRDQSTALFRVRHGKPELVDIGRDRAAWMDQAILYGVAPFFFGSGGFSDVTVRLDDIAALGVNTLLLSPVTQSPEDDFGYAVTDHFRPRSDFGTENDLRELIAQAHARGLRVVMDFVPNHLAEQHTYFGHASLLQHASPYFAFFQRNRHGEATHYFDWRNLKNLNFDHPEVQRMIIEAAAYWIRAYDIDGFRVDAAWGPRQRAPDFWPRWSRELKRIKPDLLLLAEASAQDPYYFANGFDAAYDWTEQLGRWAWRPAFENDAHTARHLRNAIEASRHHPEALIFRFINNNDTGRRFITRYGLPRTRVAAAMLLTLPGLPNLYTGEEVGAEFLPYDEEAIEWDDRHGLRAWYTRLVALRRQQTALHLPHLEFLNLGAPEQVLAYLRPGRTPRESVLVVLNYGGTEDQAELPADILFRMGVTKGLVDLLNEETILGSMPLRISLPGFGARILQAR